MIKGIIFDMDGTIIDTNHLIYESWNRIFEDNFGVGLDKKEFGSMLGMPAMEFVEHFKEKHNVQRPAEEIWEVIEKDFMENSDRITLKKGFHESLGKLKEKFKLAVGTGAPQAMAIKHLTKLGVLDYFDYVVGTDVVGIGKPAPDIFLNAADNLGLSPEECVVVEDAQLGLIAAKRASMKCVMIEDDLTIHQDHSDADAKINSLLELNEELIHKLEER